MSIKAKRVFLYILSSVQEYGCIPYHTFFKIFGVKINPNMLYGSELWGLSNISCIESLHIFCRKRFLQVNSNACNDAVMDDLGRYPMYIYSSKNCIKYLLRLLKMPNDRYPRLCYNMLLYYDTIVRKKLGFKYQRKFI
jgi:hypothetical protein